MQLSTFQTVHILQKCPGTILLFPPAQIWSDSGNTLCYFNGVRQGKGGDRFSLKLVNECDWNSHDCSYIFNTYSPRFYCPYYFVSGIFSIFVSELNNRVPKPKAWSSKTSFLCVHVHVRPQFESSLTSGATGVKQYEARFHTRPAKELLVCLRKYW